MDLDARLDEWKRFYNFNITHGAAVEKHLTNCLVKSNKSEIECRMSREQSKVTVVIGAPANGQYLDSAPLAVHEIRDCQSPRIDQHFTFQACHRQWMAFYNTGQPHPMLDRETPGDLIDKKHRCQWRHDIHKSYTLATLANCFGSRNLLSNPNI